MDRENCNSAAHFSIPQSKNTFVIQNATPFIHVGLNMHAKRHAKLTITILDVTQPLNFPVFNRVKWQQYLLVSRYGKCTNFKQWLLAKYCSNRMSSELSSTINISFRIGIKYFCYSVARRDARSKIAQNPFK